MKRQREREKEMEGERNKGGGYEHIMQGRSHQPGM